VEDATRACRKSKYREALVDRKRRSGGRLLGLQPLMG
jgi:hypothetical protein